MAFNIKLDMQKKRKGVSNDEKQKEKSMADIGFVIPVPDNCRVTFRLGTTRTDYETYGNVSIGLVEKNLPPICIRAINSHDDPYLRDVANRSW